MWVQLSVPFLSKIHISVSMLLIIFSLHSLRHIFILSNDGLCNFLFFNCKVMSFAFNAFFSGVHTGFQ
jgi:hypothetical protein